MATGTAAIVPELPERLAAAMVASEIVPEVVIVPPSSPDPATIVVVEPPPDAERVPEANDRLAPIATAPGVADAVPLFQRLRFHRLDVDQHLRDERQFGTDDILHGVGQVVAVADRHLAIDLQIEIDEEV